MSPCGPGTVEAAPAGPAGPVAPDEPFAPAGPVAPIAPAGPVAPAGPLVPATNLNSVSLDKHLVRTNAVLFVPLLLTQTKDRVLAAFALGVNAKALATNVTTAKRDTVF